MAKPAQAPPDRRIKILRVSTELVADLLMGPRIGPDRFWIPEVSGMPECFVVEAVAYEHDRDCFAFRISHPSFDEVKDCQQIPEINPTWTMHKIEINGPLPEPVAPQRGREFL